MFTRKTKQFTKPKQFTKVTKPKQFTKKITKPKLHPIFEKIRPELDTHKDSDENDRYKMLDLDSDSDDENDTLSRDFINLGLNYIMHNRLEWVHSKTFMQKEDCIIFIIGEQHETKTHKCNGIYDMFIDIIQRIKSKLQIDVMLEMSQEDVEYMKDSLSPDLMTRSKKVKLEMAQINRVRTLFVNCIKDKNCPLKVHWTDATQLVSNKRVPGWLHLFGKDPSINWNGTPKQNSIPDKQIKLISSELKTDKQLMKLLIKNGVVMKEIQKAEKVNPKFNLVFAKIFLNKIILENKFNTELLRTFNVFRTVMDIYTVARIIKLRMKNVIVYVGEHHAKRIIRMLKSLDFTMKMQTNNPECL